MNGRVSFGVLCSALAITAAGALTAAAAGERAAGTISSTTVTDAVGDAVGASGDLQSVAYTVTADGTLTLAATYANRSDLGAAPSTQFDLTTQDGAQANVAAFSGYPSQLSQASTHVAGKLEWTRLALSSIPAGARASIACTKGCHLTERLAVSHGKGASKRFVHVPFARGASFVVRVARPSGTGWWWRETVARAAAGRKGCIAPGGKLVAGRSC